MPMRIFVSIASYDDVELQKTVDDLFKKAAKPENLRVGIVDQFKNLEPIKKPEQALDSQIRMFRIGKEEARGAGYARAYAQKLYRDEEFFLQIDSHMRFVENWDRILLRTYAEVVRKEGTHKIILTQLPDSYDYDDKGNEIFGKYIKAPSEPAFTLVDFYPHRGGWGGKARKFKQAAMKLDPPYAPEPSQVILAGFVFAPASIVSEVPYDPDISFMGEEICFSMRAYTRGWRIYSPGQVLSYHMYDIHRTKNSLSRYTVENVNRNKLEEVSREKQGLILTGTITGQYGAHTKERIKVYESYVRQHIGSPYRTITAKAVKMGVRKQWKNSQTLYNVHDLVHTNTVDGIEFFGRNNG